jgi:outer membrane protein OmpA-like peptidoglycan-associated protein
MISIMKPSIFFIKYFLVVLFLCTALKAYADDGLSDMPEFPPAGALTKTSFISEKTSLIKPHRSNVKDEIKELNPLIKELVDKDSNIYLEESENRIKINVSSDILFDFDKYDLKSDAVHTLTNVASILNHIPAESINLEGHTDAIGSDGYNRTLSKKRADAVLSWLSKKSTIPATLFKSTGYGKSRPVADNVHPDGSDNPAGRQKNRRVEIVVLRKK